MTTQGNLQIDDGIIRLTINNDPDRVISFNPRDVLFAERFFELQNNFEVKLNEYLRLHKELQAASAKPEEYMDLLHKVCDYIRESIDKVFGENTSKTVFGEAYNINAFPVFFEQILKYIQPARASKIERYMPASFDIHRKKKRIRK